MDGDWHVNRHATRRMTLAELQRGPGHDRPPDMTATWQVLVVKPFGVNPGLLVADARRDPLHPALRPDSAPRAWPRARRWWRRSSSTPSAITSPRTTSFDSTGPADGRRDRAGGVERRARRARRSPPKTSTGFSRAVPEAPGRTLSRRGDAPARRPRRRCSARTRCGARAATTRTTPCRTSTAAISAACSCLRRG